MIFCLPVCFFPLQADETSEAGEAIPADSMICEILEARYEYTKFVNSQGIWDAEGSFWFKAYCKNLPFLYMGISRNMPTTEIENKRWWRVRIDVSDNPIENDTIEAALLANWPFRTAVRIATAAITEEEKLPTMPAGHEFYRFTLAEFMPEEDFALMGTPAVTSIQDVDGSESIHLSRADGKMTIAVPANKIFNVTITTVQGHTAGTYIGDSSCLEIPLAALPKGLLIVSVRSDSDSRTFKIFN